MGFEERRSVRKASSQPRTDPTTGLVVMDFDNEQIELETFLRGVVKPKFERTALSWLKKEKSAGAISHVVRRIFELSGMGCSHAFLLATG